jgi:hypothetical protein
MAEKQLKPPQKFAGAALPPNWTISNKHLKVLEETINTDRGAVKQKRHKKVKLEKKDAIEVTPVRPHSHVGHVNLDGKNYRRHYSGGNPPAEAIVRRNLEIFVSEVKRVVKEALAHKVISKKYLGSENTIGFVEKLCLSEEGIRVTGFVSKNGTQLTRSRAFMYAIRQFFKDEDFARHVCIDSVKEYYGDSHLTKKQRAERKMLRSHPSGTRMH